MMGEVREATDVDQPGLRPGALVRSLAGRDQGNGYVVLRLEDERLVSVADGRVRTFDRPKTKNRRHLEVVGWAPPSLAERLARGERIADHEITKALEALILREQKEV
jgi:large subunit ribosomal protein L14e